MEGAGRSLYSVRPMAIWRFLTTQPLSYWFICIYLLFEYVRPQQIYPSIAVAPWPMLSIVFAFGAFVLEGKRFRIRQPVDGLMGLFLLIVLLSSVFAFAPDKSFEQLYVVLSWAVIYLLISNIVTTEKRFLVFMLSFLLYNFKMSLFSTRSWAAIGFQFRDWGTVGGPGWFHNSGEFGIEMTIFFPLAVYFIVSLRRYWSTAKLCVFLLLPLTAWTGMVASSSRGALLGGTAVLCWMLLTSRYRHRIRLFIGSALLLATVVAIVPPEQKERLRNMGSDNTSNLRFTRWKMGLEMAADRPVLGVGYANWVAYSTDRYGPRATLLSHNVFIEAVAELGYSGVTAFLMLIGSTFVVNRRTRRLATLLPDGTFLSNMARGLDGALIGFLVSGFFVTVLFYPFFWVNIGMTVALHGATQHELRRVQAGLPDSQPPFARALRGRTRTA